MSTVVDNDKYIINGSTLSEIGDAIKGQTPNQYEAVAEDAVCYKYTITPTQTYSDVMLLNLTEETIQGWYQNTLPSPITAVKIIMTENDGNYSAWIRDKRYNNGYNRDFILNKSQTYSLPITIYGTYDKFTFKIYPLNGDNYLFWDSNYYYPSSSSDYNDHLYKEGGFSHKRLLPKSNFLVSDIASLIYVPIDYEGLSYGYITRQDPMSFSVDTSNNNYLTFIPLTSGQKIGFCVCKIVSNRLRVGFFQGKTYSDFQQYVTQPASSQTSIYTNGVCVSGTTELTGDGLLKRFYYTAPSDGELIITTSNLSVSAPLHVWRA